MTVFADSSALVKLYADEDGAQTVRSIRLFVVCALARVEVPVAVWRKHRLGELSAADAGVLTTAFEADWYDETGPFIPVAVGDVVLARAAALVRTHGLRSYDGVQLASALAARDADGDVDAMLCFDAELSEAAAREGLALIG